MFVMPPPPRLTPTPSQLAYQREQQALSEAFNSLEIAPDNSLDLSLAEGPWVLKDTIKLATPPHHPSEVPPPPPNPLSTAPIAPVAQIRLSTIKIGHSGAGGSATTLTGTPSRSSLAPFPNRSPPAQANGASTSRQVPFGRRGSQAPSIGSLLSRSAKSSTTTTLTVEEGADLDPTVSMSSTSPSSDTVQQRQHQSLYSSSNHSQFTTTSSSLATATSVPLLPPGAKRKKPRHSLSKNNSTFVSRLIASEYGVKRALERDSSEFAFVNINRAFLWLDLESSTKHEPLQKILFTKQHATAHDINLFTATSNHLDVIMGFTSGDIIWYEPWSAKYTRINKADTRASTAPVVAIAWIPFSASQFIAAFGDGSVVIFDKDFEEPIGPMSPAERDMAKSTKQMRVIRSLSKPSKGINNPKTNINPAAFFTVSDKPLRAFKFCPRGRQIALVGDDGYLRIIDIITETLLDCYGSLFGGLKCVAWSRDGRYIATGGEDDLVSIWSVTQRALVARCQGHTSWVIDVAFDPFQIDNDNYRFASVGDDGKVAIWDFSESALPRPKASANQSLNRTVSSQPTNRVRRASNSSGMNTSRPELDLEDGVYHPVDPIDSIPIIIPLTIKNVQMGPLTSVTFEESHLLVGSQKGQIRTWERPEKQNTHLF